MLRLVYSLLRGVSCERAKLVGYEESIRPNEVSMTHSLSPQTGGEALLDGLTESHQEFDANTTRDGELALGSENGRLLCADLEVDLQAGTVRRGGMPITLTKKQIDLLTLLMRRQERVVTR